MKVLQLYNQYRSLHGGEETVVLMTDELIKKYGGQAKLLMRSSRGLDESFWGKAKAFAGAFYNKSAYREVKAELAADRPDVVHVHNLYPLFSPSVLVACKEAGVPVVMSNHNYVLTCPTTHHLRRGTVCEKCFGGKEYHCVLTNCRGNVAESVAYAARSAYARRKGFFRGGVSQYIVLTEFAKRQLLRDGYHEEQIHVLPNMVELDHQSVDASQGDYVAFSGRMSPEKGVETLLAAARMLPEVPFRLAGHGPLLEDLKTNAPENCEFLGQLTAEEMKSFYRGARMVVIPSHWYEGCPLVVSETMSHGVPLVVSQIGGLPDLIGEGTEEPCGKTFPVRDAAQLADQVSSLWESPELCGELGSAGRRRALREYSEETYYQRLMSVYEAAMGRTAGERKLPTKETAKTESTREEVSEPKELVGSAPRTD
ncbi:MAG: glycosyltransferase [Lacipirellulaceae bacterium]